MTSGPLRYYTSIEGHELVTRRDLIPSESDHPRAGQWYYKLQLGPLEQKLPPIVANRWRRITFIVTTGDRFMNAIEINDLFEQESPASQLYVKLKEMDIPIERESLMNEERIVSAAVFTSTLQPVSFSKLVTQSQLESVSPRSI